MAEGVWGLRLVARALVADVAAGKGVSVWNVACGVQMDAGG